MGAFMASSYLWGLVETAARIVHLEAEEGQVTDKSEYKRNQLEWNALVEHFGKAREEYVAALFGDDAPGDGVPGDVQGQLAGLREEYDANLHPAIDYVEANVMPAIRKEAGKDPRMRRALRALPLIAIPVVMVIYFGIALLSGTPVTDSIQTRQGIIQRAAAAKKVIRYDEWAGVHMHRNGWVKPILLWPIQPDPYEVKGAGEFVGLVLEGQQYAKGCGLVLGIGGDTLSSAQVKLVGDVADVIRSNDLQWSKPPVVTVVTTLERVKPC